MASSEGDRCGEEGDGDAGLILSIITVLPDVPVTHVHPTWEELSFPDRKHRLRLVNFKVSRRNTII